MNGNFGLKHFKKVTLLVTAIFLCTSVCFVPIASQAGYVPPATITTADIIAADVNIMIVYPHMGTPVFVEPGGQFTAEVAAPGSYGTSGWTAWVENDYQKWDCTVGTVEYGANKIYLDTRTGYRIPVTVPSNVSPELCTLVLQHGTDITLRAPMSVSIVPTLNTSFYICGITDTHMGKYPANGGSTIELMAKALTIAGARFFSHTGDISLAPDCSRAYGIENNLMGNVIKGRVPFIVAEGNHEYDIYVEPAPSNTWGTRTGDFDYEDFDRFFGMRSQIMMMGSFAAVKHGFGAYWMESQWLRDALTAKWNALTGASYRLLMQHTHYHAQTTPMFQTSNPAQNPMPSPYPNLEIKGHDHQWAVNSSNPFLILSLGGNPWDRGESCLLNFNYNNGSWSCPQATTSFNEANNRFNFDPAGNGVSALRDSFANPNDGTATTNTCTITNDLNFNFYDGRERFIMAPGNYKVTGGTILSQYLSADGTKTIVLVRVNIPAMGTATVSISSAGATPTPTPTPTPEPQESTFVVNDNFDATATGSVPAGWSVVTTGGTAAVTEVPSASEKSIKLYKSATANSAMATNTFTSQSGEVTIETSVRTDETASGWKAAPYIKNSLSADAAGIAFAGGNIYALNGGGTTLLQPFTAGTWYNVKMLLDTDTDKYDVYIDGVKRASQLAFANPVTEVSKIMYNEGDGTSGTVYVNYAKVATCPVYVNETFNGTAVGSLPSGWTATTSGGTVAVAAVPSSTDKSLQIGKTSAPNSALGKKLFEPVNGKVILETNIMTDATDYTKNVFVRNNSAMTAAQLTFDYGRICAYDGASYINLQTFTANIWYRIRFELDTAVSKYTVYVDETSYGPYSFVNPVMCLGELMFGMWANNIGNMYVNTTMVSSEPTMLYDNFDDEMTGGPPGDGWQCTTSGGTATIEEVPSATNKSLKIYKAGSANSAGAWNHNIGSVSGIITLETRVKTDEINTGWKNIAYLQNTGGTDAVAIAFNNANIIALNGSSGVNVGTITAGTWYTLKLVMNTDTDKYDLYVNGTQVASQFNFYHAVTEIDTYYALMGSPTTGTIYVDYVDVY